jgi:hypothetical protein
MSCADYIIPSNEEFVAKGSSGSEVGSYESTVQINLPENITKGVLAVNLYDLISNKYESFTIIVPNGQCSNTNCVVLTKNINKTITILLSFNNLIKGNRYTLNYCFYYNPNIVLGTEATPQPTPTATPIQPTPTATPLQPTSTPTSTPLPTATNDLTSLVPPLISTNNINTLAWFNINDYDVNALIEAVDPVTKQWVYGTGPFNLPANSGGSAPLPRATDKWRIKAITNSSESSYNTSDHEYSYSIDNTTIPPFFVGSGVYNNNDKQVYAVIERFVSNFNGSNSTIFGSNTAIINPYSAIQGAPFDFAGIDYVTNRLYGYRCRFASVGPGTAVTNWTSNVGFVVSTIASNGFPPAASSIVRAPIITNGGIYNNNNFNINIAIIGINRQSSQYPNYDQSVIVYDIQPYSTYTFSFNNNYEYRIIAFIPSNLRSSDHPPFSSSISHFT